MQYLAYDGGSLVVAHCNNNALCDTSMGEWLIRSIYALIGQPFGACLH